MSQAETGLASERTGVSPSLVKVVAQYRTKLIGFISNKKKEYTRPSTVAGTCLSGNIRRAMKLATN